MYAKLCITNEKGVRKLTKNEKKRLTVSFSKNIADDLEKLAQEQGLTKSGLLTVLITQEVERKEIKQKK